MTVFEVENPAGMDFLRRAIRGEDGDPFVVMEVPGVKRG